MTPIDWKPQAAVQDRPLAAVSGRQSLVTPIDWKLSSFPTSKLLGSHGRQSLVTPIDWKQGRRFLEDVPYIALLVANPW